MNWNRKELKEKAKASFKNNYWKTVLVGLILACIIGEYSASTSSSSDSSSTQSVSDTISNMNLSFNEAMAILGISVSVVLIIFLIDILLTNPLEVGCRRFFLVNNDQKATLGELSYGFKHYANVVQTMLFKDIFLILWCLLFIVPGIIKMYSYKMVPYILADNPTMGSMEAINLSRKMMDGNKWNTFVLDLTFIGWFILSSITGGLVGIFWAHPYYFSTEAHLYETLREAQS